MPERFSFTRSVMEKDEAFPTLGSLARRIHRLRGDRGVQLVPELLGERGVRPAVQAVTINALDRDGNPHSLIGYAILAEKQGPDAASALQHALDAAAPQGLRLDPEAGRDAA
jgi:hypothetical protein